MSARSIKDILKIIIHCSASDWGDASVIDGWHRERGWNGIGYHYVILNGCVLPGAGYDAAIDGAIQPGRPVTETGAHCRGHNHDSVGVCLIGDFLFSARQLFDALPCLLARLRSMGVRGQIYGHRDFNAQKTCPNIDTRILRGMGKF